MTKSETKEYQLLRKYLFRFSRNKKDTVVVFSKDINDTVCLDVKYNRTKPKQSRADMFRAIQH